MKIIGISGFARSGKDLFTTIAQNILQQRGIKTERYALAYELKSDLKELIWEKTHIDVFTEKTEEKVIIRPLLVAYGEVMRKFSEGTYWTDLVEKRIEKSTADIVFVTDIRHDVFQKDECWWLQNKMNGALIHITKYTVQPTPPNTRVSTQKLTKVYDSAPNDQELLNDPKVKARADYKLEWEDYSKTLNGHTLYTHPSINQHVTDALAKINVI